MVLRTSYLNYFLKPFSRPNSIFNIAVRNQLLAAFVVNIISFSHGIALGWAAPTLKRLTSDETPLDFKISLVEASWIASLVGLGSLFGNLILCNLIDIIGRKPCLLIMALPNICLWILIFVARNVEYLFAARFIGGLTGGSSLAVIPLFVNEIADSSHRGAFQAFFTIAINMGILFGYILASKLSYFLMPRVVIVLPILFLLLLLYFPETPQYLIRKGKDESALKAFQFYENLSAITPKCEEQFQSLKATIVNDTSGNKLGYRDFFTRPALKAYGIIFVLLIINQFCGVYSFVTYMSDVFTLSGAPWEPNTCTIFMGIIQLLGNITTVTCIDRYGRKMLIIISSVGVILGLTAFGGYMHLKQYMDLVSMTWIPLFLMMVIIFIGNIGITSVTLISVVEILPTRIRSTAFSFSLAVFCFLVFVSLKVFPIFMHAFGINVTMWVCAGITVLCLLFIVIFLPETKGKSMETN